MKITKIDVMKVDCKSKDHPDWSPIVCRIYTDEGIYGDGEASIAFGIGGTGAYGCLIDLSKLLIGKDPLDIEKHWETLYKSSFWAQNGGPIIFSAISALDTALWDIKGKYFGVPVYKLLGGKTNEKLRVYASQIQFGWGKERVSARTPEEYYNYAKIAVDEGYTAVKVDAFIFHPETGKRMDWQKTTGSQTKYMLDTVEKRIAKVREAVGENIDIIMENHAYTDSQSAIQIANICKKYRIMFFEEPSTPNPKLNKYVHNNIEIPIAHGERIYTRWGFLPFFENQSIELIQPDIGICGGITETKKISDMAHTYDIGVQCHVCGSPLSIVAALHMETAIPNFVIHEHHCTNLHDYNKKLCIYDYQPENGYYTVPELPGLGNELSDYCFHNGLITTIK